MTVEMMHRIATAFLVGSASPKERDFLRAEAFGKNSFDELSVAAKQLLRTLEERGRLAAKS